MAENSCSPDTHGVLFYPCCGNDWIEITKLYSERVSNFLFSDLNYQFKPSHIHRFSRGLGENWLADPDSIVLKGSAEYYCTMLEGDRNNKYRWVEPAWLSIEFQNMVTQKRISVTWRRGFGEYAIQELADKSINIFCHRGDSLGDSGSATFFFANSKKKHLPLSNLFSKLKVKFSDHAILISDSSNCSFRHLRRAAEGKLEVGYSTTFQGLVWRLDAEVRWMKSSNYGRCFEWSVVKAED